MSGRPAIEAISDDYVRSAIEQISPTSPHPPALRAPSPHAEPPEEDLLTARTEPTSAVERLPILSARSVSGTASERSACAPSAAASGRGRKKKPPPVVPRLPSLLRPQTELQRPYGRSFVISKAPRWSSRAMASEDEPGPGAYRPPASIGRQPSSLQRNPRCSAHIGPPLGPPTHTSPTAERARCAATARIRLREQRQKVSALLESSLACGEKQLTVGALTRRLRNFGLEYTDEELAERCVFAGLLASEEHGVSPRCASAGGAKLPLVVGRCSVRLVRSRRVWGDRPARAAEDPAPRCEGAFQ